MEQLNVKEYFMRLAITEAEKAYSKGEVPIGCVIVKEGTVVSSGHNLVETLQLPTAHAEIEAINEACNTLDSWRLDECDMYVTLEPCPMCAGAILNSRISNVYYGANDLRLGACGSTQNLLDENPINRVINVESGVLEEKCIEIIKQFFKALRKRNRERKKKATLVPFFHR